MISEGVGQLLAADARGKYGVDGSGVTVGVLSDSYDKATTASDGSPLATHAGDDVESGDLPGPANGCSGQAAPVDVLQDFPSSAAGDEGRAMLQIVHDVAPGADLAFATAFLSELSFAQNIEALEKPVGAGGAGAKVIVDDVFWFEEPFFQDGPIAAAVSKVVGKGAAYFSAAGNNNLFEGANEIASWEAPKFRDAGSCPAGVLTFAGLAAGSCIDFDPTDPVTDTTFAIVVSPGATLNLDLQWAEPWFGVETDLDAYLLNGAGAVIAAAESNNLAPAGQKPVEIVQWKNTSATSKTVRLAVNRCAGECNGAASGSATPAVKFALLQNGGGVTQTEYPQSAGGDVVGPAIFGHAATADAVAVAAVPFDHDDRVERYSSRGPVTLRFEPVDGSKPAAPLPTPKTIAKPDIAATDCGATTFFSFRDGAGEWRFCGTSAAAPHAAAVAALQLEADPTATVEEVRVAQTSTARPVGAFGPNAVGFGLLDADSAVAGLLPPAVVTITEHPGSRTADSTPTFGFQSIPPAAEFACSVDGGAAEPCASPHTVPAPLLDGGHLFEVEAVGFGESASFSFTVDTTPPAIAFDKSPAAVSADAEPVFAFSADEPADFACSLDGAPPQPCDSPYAVSAPLADGPHSFAVTATDQVGNSAAAAVEFTVDTPAPGPAPAGLPPEEGEEPEGTEDAADTRPPQTFIRAHPPRIVSTGQAVARAAFRFGSDEDGVTFLCKVDRGPLRPCGPRLARLFRPGAHVVRVRARDRAGNVDRTPAVFGFRVERTS